MTHRATRVFLAIVVFAAAAGAGYLLWKLDREERATRATARLFDESATQALILVERFRAAQQSYVADGQGSEFWITRASDVLDELDRIVSTIGGTTESAELRDAARATAATVEDLRKMDVRAREWVRTGQGLMASDLIFTESLASSATLAERVSTIRGRQRQLAETRTAALRQQQMYAVAAAAGICLVVAVLLTPAVRPSTPQDTREALRALIGDNPPMAIRPQPAAPPQAAAQAEAPTSSAPLPRVVTAPASVDVAGTARICSELARVTDAEALPQLLGRSAALLDARGLIVWVADQSGTSLYPMLAHGYSPAVLSRMGCIHREDDNATAVSYRLGEERIVAATDDDPGAIVTPIVTPEGCVGVLAAEVSRDAAENRDRRALASILAAQFATLVTTLPAPPQAMHAQG